MQKQTRYLLAVLLLAAMLACSQRQSARLPSVAAIVHAPVAIDGHLQDWDALDAVFEVSDFHSPWSDLPFGLTRFCAIADSAWFYFAFEATDSLLVARPFVQESDVASGDRVEIFLSGDSTLNTYYCLEMGPYGDVLDYRATYYRQFDDTWDLPDLAVVAQAIPGGYAVEGRIPLGFLRGLSGDTLTTGNFTVHMGLYRAEYHKAHTEADPVQWLTWIEPNTTEPDFHVPTSFHPIEIQEPLNR